MSEKKQQTKAPSFFSKVLNWFKRVFVTSVKNMIAELKKVSWPSRKDLMSYTAIVVVFLVVMAVVIGLLDLGATYLLQRLA